ncbi:hypothetical protein [Flaviaesturariibacter amylovorans]|uniref:Metal-dependent HD superfamily phosphohydrolase n=1 Tax=Flaviaesturariibacter amylovorans TaxID=1084520 RepID=A0ABP8GIC7_9BACT
MFRTLFFRTLPGLSLQPESLWHELEAAYQEPQRHYHTLAHLDALAEVLAPLWTEVDDAATLVLAIAYHDAVYDPARPDNEERSAELAAARTDGFLAAPQQQRLRRHILATKAHQPAGDPDTDLFTDADLSILGAPADSYDRYAADVRAEYSIYPDALYRPGRAAVLRRFLAADRVFKTPYFYNQYEASARANLQRELSRLEAPDS